MMRLCFYVPYTYYLYCKPIKKHYYGVRYAKGCVPEDFWSVYFTSSKIIHSLIEIYGKSSFFYEIRRTFRNDPNAALLWEQKVLRRLKVENKINWLNRGLSGDKPNFYSVGEEPWNKGVPSKIKGCKFYNNGNIAKMYFPGEQPEGWKEGRLNKAWNNGLTIEDERVKINVDKMNSVERKSAWNKGKTKNEDDRLLKISNNLKEKVKCGEIVMPSFSEGICGENNGHAKFTNNQAEEIRLMKETSTFIAKQFNVSISAICRIRKNQTYPEALGKTK